MKWNSYHKSCKNVLILQMLSFPWLDLWLNLTGQETRSPVKSQKYLKEILIFYSFNKILKATACSIFHVLTNILCCQETPEQWSPGVSDSSDAGRQVDSGWHWDISSVRRIHGGSSQQCSPRHQPARQETVIVVIILIFLCIYYHSVEEPFSFNYLSFCEHKIWNPI